MPPGSLGPTGARPLARYLAHAALVAAALSNAARLAAEMPSIFGAPAMESPNRSLHLSRSAPLRRTASALAQPTRLPRKPPPPLGMNPYGVAIIPLPRDPVVAPFWAPLRAALVGPAGCPPDPAAGAMGSVATPGGAGWAALWMLRAVGAVDFRAAAGLDDVDGGAGGAWDSETVGAGAGRGAGAGFGGAGVGVGTGVGVGAGVGLGGEGAGGTGAGGVWVGGRIFGCVGTTGCAGSGVGAG